ncbi:putative leucine-rich repeat-containing protein DDB_G0290503 isoform X3 [Arabidopsis lyrata subsp. lyrata]|uniref:putative leucine-rich repeat-containing protein DDB_G0290503 isoform X3 n=1 Tax=Arabidopsis lyrata subsp. lyrata TaxID=81972 RepID=UPI000A29CC61|nr:putative leucine-rich repeat-containing protein DDB_G0290503 isoform X3 [Arabidopsis lyrata subsp. lyrata]|eukprot:XP_020882922.1 putative leucine-rich repeat-containing protein DDB_G0290503 isoform X3 [Arabidopsis lyrata subsp. lyrata]
MEDDKKKKRNKKKKNKPNNKRVDDAIASGATTFADENHIGDGDVPQISERPDVDESQSSHQINVVATQEDDSGVENKSQGSEVLLEETIKQLREENGSYLQKEAGFEENVRRLETENEAHIQKEAFLEERLVHLKTENEAHIQNEARLEERLLHLRSENEAHKQNEEKLEERLVQYKNKNDMLLREMSSTEAQMRQLLDERSTFTQKEVSLEKKVQQLQHDEESLVAEEKSSREMISSLNNEIARLRAQVTELEESKSNLLEQNQSLKETVSSLQVQHENHDSNAKGASEEELNSQIEAACTLVEKLITENAELVEKVNELCIKLNQSQHASPESLAIEVEKSESLEEIPIHDELIRIDNSKDMDTALIKRNLSEGEIEETVPLSLNANGEVDVESQVVVAGEDEVSAGVPLADAPLIGAPFRLVSFVARYVSGADLAAKK